MTQGAKPAVVVTGVSSGIGLAVAEDLLTHGYRVFGSVRKAADAAPLQEQWPADFVPLILDVTKADELPAVVAQVKAQLNGLDLTALVNNAGMNLSGPLMLQPLDEFRRVLEVNVVAMLAVTQAFLPLLGARLGRTGPAGRVVNMGSVSGAITVPFLGAYSVSKHAVEALSQGLRRELLLYGVNVSTIEPGAVSSRLGEKRLVQNLDARYANTDYAPWLAQFGESIGKQENSAPPPDRVTRAVRHAIESPKPRTRYPLDNIWQIGRILPDRAFDKLIFKALGLVLPSAKRSGG